MENFLDKILRNDKTMKSSLVIMIMCWVYSLVSNVIVNDVVDSLLVSLLVATAVYGCIVVWTYKTHEKNIMKPALGMLMGSVVIFFSVSLFDNIFTEANRATYFASGVMGYVTMILDILKLVVFLNFSLIHLAMNKTHESSPRIVNFNKLEILMLFALYAIEVLLNISTLNAVEIINKIVFYLGIINLTILICSIEVNIDYFRAVRQAKKQEQSLPTQK